MKGNVLDVGGKKKNRRGYFHPPEHLVNSWEYVNTDPGTDPDYLCSAENIPVENGSKNCIILTEILEHVVNPGAVLDECHRILAPQGTLILSMPFLVGIHGNPEDYRRWTISKIRSELLSRCFSIEDQFTMGGVIAVGWDLLHMALGSRKRVVKVLYKILRLFIPVAKVLDTLLPLDFRITTGYFLIGKKL